MSVVSESLPASNTMPAKPALAPNYHAPAWLTLQNALSVLALLGLIVGFFVQNAIWQERLDRLRADFDEERKLTRDTLKEINTNFQVIQNQLSYLKGEKDADKGRK